MTPPERSLTGSRILLTGGAGAVGSTVADRLVAEGPAEIRVLEAFTRGSPENLAWAVENGPVTIVEGDLRDRDVVYDVMSGIDVVIHLAAIRVTQCADDPRLALEVMADGTFNVAEAAVARGVSKVVAASSAAVYGMADTFPTPESCPPYNNRTMYGACKSFNEALFRSFNDQYGLDYIMLRYFNVYGPRMDIAGPQTEVMIRWIQRISAGESPLILGDGSQTMDFVHVSDAARATLLAAESGITDEVFNIGTGVETSLNDLAQLLLRVMGSTAEPEYGPERATNPVPRRLADISMAERHLGFRAQVSLEDGLRDLVSWWEKATGARRGSGRTPLHSAAEGSS